MTDMSGKTAIVVGASRGLGFGITTALAQADAHVIAVSRAVAAFPKPAGGSGTIEPEIADVLVKQPFRPASSTPMSPGPSSWWPAQSRTCAPAAANVGDVLGQLAGRCSDGIQLAA
jgi:NAD(P)-dependent dehydrogenase (short-subunit alcohol dehydrogenase family)